MILLIIDLFSYILHDSSTLTMWCTWIM